MEAKKVGTAKLVIDDKTTLPLDIYEGAQKERGLDISKLRSES